MSRNGQTNGTFRAVILDYGAVLCHQPLPHEIEFMASAFRVTPSEFPALYASSRHEYDRGDLSTSEYWASLARQTGIELAPETLACLRRTDKEMWSRINIDMTNWLATLRPAGYQTALLSNMQQDMIAHLRENFPWLSDFDHQIFSAEVRAVKPDAAIYHHCLKVLKVEPHAAIFVDDRAENIATARSLGIAGFQFHSVPQLRKDLKTAGFPHLP
jgi:putative hydrolase of the HAD superfamily